MTRSIASLLVLLQLAAPVLLGEDACVTDVDHPCHVEDADGSHRDAHEGHPVDLEHADLGSPDGHAAHCDCVCHTPLVLRTAPAVGAEALFAALPADAPGTAADGHRAPPFHPPRTI